MRKKERQGMIIKISAFPGPRTEQIVANAQAALSTIEPDGAVHWVHDVHELIKQGVTYTPEVTVNDKVKVTGRVPSIHELTKWIEEELPRAVEA
jgi:hypothetical protein